MRQVLHFDVGLYNLVAMVWNLDEAMVKPLSAAVLVGGRSRRMGADKALLRFGDSTILERTLDALASVARDIRIIGERDAYHRFGVPVEPDAWPGCGSLGGVATAIMAADHPFVLCVACDMPLLSRTLLRAMAAVPRDYLVLAPVTSSPVAGSATLDRIHPLHAVYSRASLDYLTQRLEAQCLRTVDAILALRPLLLDEVWMRRFDPQLESLANVNTPQELATAAAVYRLRQGAGEEVE